MMFADNAAFAADTLAGLQLIFDLTWTVARASYLQIGPFPTIYRLHAPLLASFRRAAGCNTHASRAGPRRERMM